MFTLRGDAMGTFFRVALLSVLLFFLAVAVSNVAASVPHQSQIGPNSQVDQGCVNQGKDRRWAAPVVCGLQRVFSWKSEHRPHLFRIGSTKGAHADIAWPPYFVFNAPQRDGHWRMFRIGFRYDRDWHGYIFPTAAAKSIKKPLQY
jgi:hypothetical protein